MIRDVAKIALTILLIGSPLQHYCYANEFNGSNIAIECKKISTHLRELTRINPESYCTGDIESVANSLEQTGKQLIHNTPEKILAAIKYAELELKQIKSNRSYCAQFTSLMNPIINEVKNTGHEIEAFVSDYFIT